MHIYMKMEVGCTDMYIHLCVCVHMCTHLVLEYPSSVIIFG